MHTLRKDKSNITRKALEWNPKGRRKSMEAYLILKDLLKALPMEQCQKDSRK